LEGTGGPATAAGCCSAWHAGEGEAAGAAEKRFEQAAGHVWIDT
jgi:hypothetical protein